MTFPIATASECVAKLQQYIADERPLNLQEMGYFLNVLDPLTKSCKNIVMNVKPDTLPGYLINDFLTLKKKI